MRSTIKSDSEWQEASYPMGMLRFLGERITDRKEKLLYVACYRRVWRILKTERSRRAVEVLEQYVEGNATAEQLAEAREDAWQSLSEIPNPQGNQLPESHAFAAVGLHDSRREILMGLAEATAWEKVGTPDAVSEPEEGAQCVLIREVFGNPFRPVAFDPAWRTSTVLALAQGIYDERAFDRMPILADALQDAGCDSEDILTHCRGPGPHVRGCWVVDLVLGKK